MMTVPLLVCLILAANPPAAVRITPGSDGNHVEVTASILPGNLKGVPAGKLTQEQGEKWLRLALVDQAGKDGPAILGSYERRRDDLIFRPRYPLTPGLLYRACFEPGRGEVSSAAYRVPPRPPTPAAVVEQVFPGSDVLPANHLRFHLHFSRPMRGGEDLFNHIHLLNADGKEVDDPWLREELWDDDNQELLLYIHPGRIKWGLLLRMLFGPVLEPDRQYTLVIDRGLLDAHGQQLAKEFRKQFRTTAEDRRRLELADWKVQPPTSGTTQAVRLSFPKSIDRFSLKRFLTVVDAEGSEVAGRMEIGSGERSWSFQPAKAWRAGPYRIIVDGKLEDTAGNTPLRPFDLDLRAPVLVPQELRITFQPMPK